MSTTKINEDAGRVKIAFFLETVENSNERTWNQLPIHVPVTKHKLIICLLVQPDGQIGILEALFPYSRHNYEKSDATDIQ